MLRGSKVMYTIVANMQHRVKTFIVVISFVFHSCCLFSSHGHMACGYWIDHCNSPEILVSDYVFHDFALK